MTNLEKGSIIVSINENGTIKDLYHIENVSKKTAFARSKSFIRQHDGVIYERKPPKDKYKKSYLVATPEQLGE